MEKVYIMERFIEDTIEKIYIKKDYDFFISQCNKELDFTKELKDITSKVTKSVTETPSKYKPSVELTYKYDSFEKDELKISYTSILEISKIAPVFFIQHEAEVVNLDINRMSDILYSCNFMEYGYTKHQFKFYECVSQFLIDKGYTQLFYPELMYAIPNIKIPDNITLPYDKTMFTSQMTVKTTLFRDVFNLNSDISK